MFRYANELCLVLFSTNRNCMNRIKYDTSMMMDGWMDPFGLRYYLALLEKKLCY